MYKKKKSNPVVFLDCFGLIALAMTMRQI